MNFKKILFVGAILGLTLVGFSACSNDDDDKLTGISRDIIGTWNITGIGANVESNNQAVASAIKKSIEDPDDEDLGNMLAILEVIDISFAEKSEFGLSFELMKVSAKGKYTGKNDIVTIKSIESIDLGNLADIIGQLPPGSIPEGIDIKNLDKLINSFLPIELILTNVTANKTFTGRIDLTKYYNTPEKIAEIIDKAGLEGVVAADVTISKVEAIITSSIKGTD